MKITRTFLKIIKMSKIKRKQENLLKVIKTPLKFGDHQAQHIILQINLILIKTN